MKIFRLCLVVIFTGLWMEALAQDKLPDNIVNALRSDDSVGLSKLVNKENVNNCYGNYSLLSHAVRFNSAKCFNLLIGLGSDVNKSCNGYVPPLMHAAKYGRLEMAKVLVGKGADINYKYEGNFGPANGETPMTYAEKNNHPEIADYIRSLKK